MKEETVLKIREFTRFYLPALDLLGNHYLGSEYSATEARVLYEVYTNDGCNAAYIARAMRLDKSYLSRIIKSHEKNGYLIRVVSEKDSRAFDLHLTEAGVCRAQEFIERSNQYIEKMIRPLNQRECGELRRALAMATVLLAKCRAKNEETAEEDQTI